MVGHGNGPIEVAKTVLEVAEVAWSAIETHHHIHQHHHDHDYNHDHDSPPSNHDLESIRTENRRLRSLLQKNLELLRDLSLSPCLSKDCPPDLHARLAATVDSKHFLSRLKSLHGASVDGATNGFPFKEVTGEDLHSAEILINVDPEEPSWWVWVTDEAVPNKVEEWSEIDDENYVVISEEHVVDGVANFIARCILSNPKTLNLTPEELQKAVSVSVSSMNKYEKMASVWHAGMMFYTLATWGIALAGLYRSRAVMKLAAKGVHTTSKFIMKAL